MRSQKYSKGSITSVLQDAVFGHIPVCESLQDIVEICQAV